MQTYYLVRKSKEDHNDPGKSMKPTVSR